MDDKYELIEKIQNGPRFLFLGQRYRSLNQNVDKFLVAIKKNYFNDLDIKDEELTYELLLKLNETVSKSTDLVLGWMQKKCDRIEIPEWLNAISRINWNGIYTTSIDNMIPKVFRNSWREFHPIYNENNYPMDIRSKLRLHGTFLFGSINRVEKNEIPPFDEFDFLESKQRACALLKRLPELLTPFGVIIIDGYDYKKDFLKFEDLYSSINALKYNQAHIFSFNKQYLIKDKYAKRLIDSKKLIVHEEGFSDFLIKAEKEGLFDFEQLTHDDDENSKRITINGLAQIVPKNVYNNISSNVIVLDDSINFEVEEVRPFMLKEYFKEFLLNSSINPVWDGYKRKFNIERNFEIKLYATVQEELKTKFDSKTIILHGQAGAGKSVSLGYIAYKLKKENIYPIIFIERKNEKPSFDSIDIFCKWLEDNGAEKTIIIWDDSVYSNELSQYNDLNKYLVTRGRKIVVIGSSYKVSDEDCKNDDFKFIEAKVKLEKNEITSLKEIWKKVHSTVPEEFDKWNLNNENNFLVALYRLLPITKLNLRKSIGDEITKNEEELTKILDVKDAVYENLLAQKLIEAMNAYGINYINEENNDEDRYSENEINKEIQKLTELIMVPGQFGLGVPIELILRIINKGFNQKIVKIFDELDVFKVIQRENGNIEVCPRHTVEAKLLVQYRIGNIKTQVEIICNLIENIKSNAEYGGNNEISFIVELIKQIGPNSKENLRQFTTDYLKISESLEILRKENGIINSRLLLQESTLLREYVQNIKNIQNDNKLELIKKAENVIKEAIDTESGNRNNKFKSYLFNELASNLGVQLKEYINNKCEEKEIRRLFDDIRKALKIARAFDPDTYYPIDVWAWSTEALVESSEIDEVERGEILADALHLFERVESENINISERADFNTRRNQIAKLCGKNDIEEETFNKLLKLNSGAGIYMVAMRNLNDVNLNDIINHDEKKICFENIEYLEKFDYIINNDTRCLYLLLKLKWLYYNSKPIFYQEKQTTAFSLEVWAEIYKITNRIVELENEFTTTPIKYIEAVSLFHLGDFNQCKEIFETCKNDKAYGRRRIIASHLASTQNGVAKVYSGSIESYDENANRGWMYIEDNDIRDSINFSGKELIGEEIRIHSTYDDLNIAFNFLGPYILKNNNHNKVPSSKGGNNDVL
ncbi:hypothetical protein [Clostridium beijerinckii]|uniref:hypothetical protein n=1 Tax=Clostridium beijerinckii TaxID=1520 RepID=UPI00232D148B|nr:hypothetical protein [Clostridium beijerinckii]